MLSGKLMLNFILLRFTLKFIQNPIQFERLRGGVVALYDIVIPTLGIIATVIAAIVTYILTKGILNACTEVMQASSMHPACIQHAATKFD